MKSSKAYAIYGIVETNFCLVGEGSREERTLTPFYSMRKQANGKKNRLQKQYPNGSYYNTYFDVKSFRVIK